MDCKQIEQLLNRYWRCETSLEEEAELRTFFNEGNVPQHLLRYKDLFVYQQVEQQVCLGKDFDARVLAEVEAPVVRAKRLTLTFRLMPLFKAVAVLTIIFSLGNVAQHSFLGDVKEVAAADTIGKQISAPSVALSGGDVTVSHEQQLLDSLHRMRKTEELKK